MPSRAKVFAGRGLALRAGCLVLALCGQGGAALAAPQVFDLLPEQSFVYFEVLHFGTSTIRGRLGPLQGVVRLDPDTANNADAQDNAVSLRVATNQVDTGSGIFNARLRQSDLLDSTGHPEAFFVARNLRFAAQHTGQTTAQLLAEVRGEFTLRGVSQPLSLVARQYGCWTQALENTASPQSATVCGGDFEGELLRSTFGATFGLPFVADRVRLVVHVAGRQR